MGERCGGKEPLFSPKTVTGWATQQAVLGYDIDAERMTIALPAQTVDELRARLTAQWPAGRQAATMNEALALAGKLHHRSFPIRAGRYFIRRRLQSTNLRLNGAERAGGVGAWGRYRKQAEARQMYACRLNHGRLRVMVMGFGEMGGGRGEKITAPSFSFVKQLSSRTWFSDASLRATGGLCIETWGHWRIDLPEEVQKRTIGGGQAVDDLISIYLLEVKTVVMRAYVMVDMRGDRSVKTGEAS